MVLVRNCKKSSRKKKTPPKQNQKTLTPQPSLQEAHSTNLNPTQPTQNDNPTAQDFADKISHAFQLATAQGPMCHEPVQGIAVFLEEVIVRAPTEDEPSAREVVGRLTGEVIKTTRDSIRQGFLDWSPRLLLAMYSCEIQASSTSIPPLLFHPPQLTLLPFKNSRRPRPRLRRHHPPAGPHHLGIATRRHRLLHRPRRPPRRRVLRLQRRDAHPHLRRRLPPARLPRL